MTIDARPLPLSAARVFQSALFGDWCKSEDAIFSAEVNCGTCHSSVHDAAISLFSED